MTPIKHPHCNDVLKAPIGSEAVNDLHIARDKDAVWSFWRPNAEELIAINNGGCVALRVEASTHPPLNILATHPHEDAAHAIDSSEYQHRMEAVNGRINRLVALVKQIVAAWVSETADTPRRRRLVDSFLDMINPPKKGAVVDVAETESEPPPAVTQTDVDRYRSDAEGWKAEAERIKAEVAEKWPSMVVDKNAYEAAKADLARVDAGIKRISDALGEDWNTMQFDEAITAIKNRLAMAEAARDEWQRRAEKCNDYRIAAESADAEAAHWKGQLTALRVKIEDMRGTFDGWLYDQGTGSSGYDKACDAILALPELKPNQPES